jgi:hypothetical protein
MRYTNRYVYDRENFLSMQELPSKLAKRRKRSFAGVSTFVQFLPCTLTNQKEE